MQKYHEMKPRLLIGTDCFLPRKDGISLYLRTVIPSLAHDFEITIVAPHYKGELDRRPFSGMEIVFFDLSSFSFGDFTLSKLKPAVLKRLIAQANLIWTHTLGPIGAYTIYHARHKHIVAQVHSRETELFVNSLSLRYSRTLFDVISTRVVRSLYNKCSLLMLPSEDTKTYVTHLGVRTPTQIVQMGVDSARFHPAPSKAQAKQALRIDPSTFVFGYTGRIAGEKDLGTLLKAFTLFRKRYPDSLLLIVGDGPDRASLQHDGVRITGFVQNVVPFLHAMDAFILPSLTETTSLSTLEALFCGLPVIVTPVGHIRAYVEHEFNGLIFGKRDVEGLLAHMGRLYTDQVLYKRISAKARKSVEKKYTSDRMCAQVRELLLGQLKNP